MIRHFVEATEEDVLPTGHILEVHEKLVRDFFFTVESKSELDVPPEVGVVPLGDSRLNCQSTRRTIIASTASTWFMLNTIGAIHQYFKGKLKIDRQPASDDEVKVSWEKATSFKKWLDH